MNVETVLCTIGHSSHSIEEFLRLLTVHSIEAVADVRSSPYSKYHPQYNRDALRQSLSHAGITYVFLGKELGARRSERECYENHRVVYHRVTETAAFQKGLERVVEGVSKMRIALMCAEKDPLTCHRTILVARALQSHVDRVLHILADGSLESQAEAERRLLKECKLSEGDLFTPVEERIDHAYKRREIDIAYVEPIPAES